jgi:hypothetical protein
MPSNPLQYDRSSMPQMTSNLQMAQDIESSPVFSAIANQVTHEREVQAMRYPFIYTLSGEVNGQQSMPFTLLIDQGSDFLCRFITGSCYSYDARVGHESSFPIPNSMGVTSWAGRGLSFMFTDTRSGTQLMSDMVPAEVMLTPGYGMTFVEPVPFTYFFWRNSKLKVDVRNRDNATRAFDPQNPTIPSAHQFNISLHGYKVFTPGSAV